MPDALDALTKSLLQAATKAGADAADAMAITASSVSIEVRGGALEQAERSEGTDIGLRVFVGHRTANVSASDTSSRTIEEMAERAVAMAREAPEDPYAGLADPDQLSARRDAEGLELCDPAPEPSPEALQDDAARAEAAALAAASAGGLEKIVEFLLGNMSKRMAESLRDEMNEVGDQKPKAAEAAMNAVVAVIRRQADAGTITLITDEEEA